MTLHAGTSHKGRSARRASAGRTAGLRRASLAALILLLIQYGIVTSVIGLLALVGATAQGAAFVDKARSSASMSMAVLTGVALLCYSISLYLPGSPGPRQPDRADAS